jgi:hypothetical protein
MSEPMRLVFLESPYAGDVARNVAYGRACMLDCLRRGEAPFASHLLYTQCLDDDRLHERALGMEAGFAWAAAASISVFYTDFGMSGGMVAGENRALAVGRGVVKRTLAKDDPFWDAHAEATAIR